MSPASEYAWRPIALDDVDAWVVLLAAITAADQDGEHTAAEELAEYFSGSYFDFPRGSTAAFDASGAMVAYSYFRARTEANPVHELWMYGGVHPAHRGRGLGTRLLEWADAASAPLHEERFPGRPLSITANRMAGNTGAAELFAVHGYRAARWFNEMSLDLARPLPAAAVPAGVEFLPFTAERSEDGRLVRNESFRDHWGSTVSTPEAWAMVVHANAFRPAFTFVAYQDGVPLGLVLAEEYDGHLQATGRRDLYIALVGTRRAGRRRGLATALLTHALELGRAAGFDTASLGVDADSPTGALGLYERIGFRVENTWATHLKPLIGPR